MNRVKELNFEVSRWFFAKVLENTPFTIILTVLVSSFFALYFEEIWKFRFSVLGFLIALVLFYYFFSHEKVIKKVKLNEDNITREWENNEIRHHIPSIASVTDHSLYIQFMDIPFTLNQDLPNSYCLEFKAKVINACFAWCVNANIEGTNMRGYMFQYNPLSKKLRPHFLSRYDPTRLMTLWVIPDSPNVPLQSVTDLSLKSKKGWYFMRTEVFQYETTIRMPDLDSPAVRRIIPVYTDAEGNVINFERANINRVVEIKIYDMNDLARNIYHILFNEPPFKCFWGGKIGFRNYALESALYKDVVIRRVKRR